MFAIKWLFTHTLVSDTLAIKLFLSVALPLLVSIFDFSLVTHAHTPRRLLDELTQLFETCAKPLNIITIEGLLQL